MEIISMLFVVALYFLFWFDIKIYIYSRIIKSKRNKPVQLKDIRDDEQLVELMEKIKFPDAKRVFMNEKGRATIEAKEGKYSFKMDGGKLMQAEYTEIKGIDGYIEEELIKKYLSEYTLNGNVLQSIKVYKKVQRNNMKLALSFISVIIYLILLLLFFI